MGNRKLYYKDPHNWFLCQIKKFLVLSCEKSFWEFHNVYNKPRLAVDFYLTVFFLATNPDDYIDVYSKV